MTISATSLEAQTVGTFPMIGATVWWNLGGARPTHVALTAALAAAGWDFADPGTPTTLHAAKRALRSWRRDCFGGSREGRVLIRHIPSTKDSEWVVFAVVLERVDAELLGLSYGTSFRVFFNDGTKRFFVTADGVGPIEQATVEADLGARIAPYWQDAQILVSPSDIGECIKDVLKHLGAVRLRREGPPYFLAKSELPAVYALRALFEALPGDTFLSLQGVPDMPEYKTTLLQSVHAGLMDEIAEAEAEFTDLLGAAGTARKDALGNRMIAFRKLAARTEVYADLLSLRTEEAQRRIAALRTKASALLELPDEDEAAGAAPAAVVAEAPVIVADVAADPAPAEATPEVIGAAPVKRAARKPAAPRAARTPAVTNVA